MAEAGATQVLISYARSTEDDARAVAAALRAMGYQVWRDDALPAHRTYAEVIESELRVAKAVVVVWSADAAASQWVRAEADLARTLGTLVQLRIDDTIPPLPFNQIHCADLRGWAGDTQAVGWRTVAESVRALVETGPRPDAAQPQSAPKVAAPHAKPSVAVLPFANQTGAADDYFADGMLEEIVTALSRFQTLFVISSSSTLSYRGQDIDPKTVMHELGARYLVEGSVRKAGDRVRISMRLVDAVRGAQVWGERFEGDLDDVFGLQDRIAGSVAGALDSTIEAAEIARAHHRPTGDGTAYDLYLRARAQARYFGEGGLRTAIEFLDQALAIDPNFAHAMVVAGYCHSSLYAGGWAKDPARTRQVALDFCTRALRQDDHDAHVLGYASGILVNVGEDLDDAGRLAEHGLQIAPSSTMLLFWSAWVKAVAGDPHLAIERFEEANRLDPRSPMRPFIRTGIGMALFTLKDFEAAAVPLSEAVRTLPDYPTANVLLIACNAHLGRMAEAREGLQRLGSTGALAAAALLMKRPGPRRDLLKSGLELAAATDRG